MDVRKVTKQIYTHRPTRRALIVGLIFTIYLMLLGNRIGFVHVMVVDADGAPVANARVRYRMRPQIAPGVVIIATYYLSGEQFAPVFDLTRIGVTDASGKLSTLVLGNEVHFEEVEHPDYIVIRVEQSDSLSPGIPAWFDGMYDYEKAWFQGKNVIKATAAQPVVIPVMIREKLGDWSRPAIPASPEIAAAIKPDEKALLAEIDPIAWDEVQSLVPREQLRERWSTVLRKISPSTLLRLTQATDHPATRWALLEIARRSQIRGLESVAMAAIHDNIESELAAWRYLAWWGDPSQFATALAQTKARDRQRLPTSGYAAAYLARSVKPSKSPRFSPTLGQSFPDGGSGAIDSFDDSYKFKDKAVGHVLHEILSCSSKHNFDRAIGFEVFLVSQSDNPRFSLQEILNYILIVEASRDFVRDKKKVTSLYVWEVIAMHSGPVPDEIALKLPICGLRLASEPTTAPATP